MKAEGGAGTLDSAAKNFAIYGLVLGAVMGLVALFSSLLVDGASSLTTRLFVFAVMVVLMPMFATMGGLISSGLYFAFAKLLGGKGTFAAQTYFLSMIMGGMMLLTIPFQVLGAIPLVGMVFSLGSFLVSLYGIYSEYRMLKELHQLSTLKTICVLLGPMILFAIVVVAIIAIVGAMFLSTLSMAGPVQVA
jgi:hypothetical protein